MANYDLTPDYTGSNPEYLAEQETHNFGSNTTRRVLMPMRGVFYGASFKMVEVSTGRELTLNDYSFTELIEEATEQSGKPCYASVVIGNHVKNPILVKEYQFVGGFFMSINKHISDAQTAIDNVQTYVDYSKVVGIPEEGLPPSFHEHGEANTFNWWGVREALERLNNALVVKHDAMHDLLRQRIESARNALADNLQPVIDLMDVHTARRDDPHQTTAAKIGAYSREESQALIDMYYNLTETVADSLKFDGKSRAQMRNLIQDQLDASAFVNGILKPERLGINNDPSKSLILTSMGWKDPVNVETTSEVMYMGTTTEEAVMNTLINSPVGTKCSFHVSYNAAQVHYGNAGTYYFPSKYRNIIKKVALPNVWEKVGG